MKWPLKLVLSIILPDNAFFLLKDYFQNCLICPTYEACLCCGAILKCDLKKSSSERLRKQHHILLCIRKKIL